MTAKTLNARAGLLAPLPQPSAAYKRRVWLAVASLVVFIVLYFVLAGWFLFTAYRLTIAADTVAFEGYLVAGCSVFLAMMMLKPLFFVKHGGTEDSIEITREQQPRLFDFLHDLADRARAPRPHRVFLSPVVNAAVFYDLSALNLIFPTRKNLEIGLGLVNVVTLGELRAVLAHEFGHFTQSSMAVFRWSYLAQQIAAHLVNRRDKLDAFLVRLSHFDVRVAWIGWALSLIVWSIRSLVDSVFGMVVIIQRALSREMEFQADLVAVSLTGSDALINALHRLQAADDSWDRAVGVVGGGHGKGPPRDFFEIHTAVMDRTRAILGDPSYGLVPPIPVGRAAAHRLFKAELAQPPKMWLTHPLNHEREANCKRRYVRAELDDNSAWTILDDTARVREQVSAMMMGPDAPAAASSEEWMEVVDGHFAREFLNSRYRGCYLGRSVVRSAARASMLVDPPSKVWRQQLDDLYPEGLTRELARLRQFEKELAQLRALHSGALAPPAEGIRYRGREIKRREIPGSIERLMRDIAAVEKRLGSGDRMRRSAHMAAATELGAGWAKYLEGLLATLHYADHTASNIEDLHGVLAHTVHISTVTGRISSGGRKRVLAAANELHGALSRVFAQSSALMLDTTLLQRLEAVSWTEMLGNFDLGEADEENLGDWLDVIDGWVRQAAGPCSALRSAALEQLLLTEAALAAHIREMTPPAPAPEPSRVPEKYDTLLAGKERELKARLNWWERFQIADGAVPTAARVAVAAGIVATVLGFGGTFGNASLTIYNGLAIPVIVTIGEDEVPLGPLASRTQLIATAGVHHIEARTREGKVIEAFDPEVPGSFARFVYNVAGATPMVEWTAVYGNSEPEPENMVGAKRWSRTSADILFAEPPDSIGVGRSGGARRRVLTGVGDFDPTRQLAMVADSAEAQQVIAAHARWDAMSSPNIIHWLGLALDVSPDREILAARLAEEPDNVILLRFERDAVTGAARDSVCARHRAMALASPDEGDLHYVAARCIADDDERARSFLDGYVRWPDNGWLAYGAGLSHARVARWDEALAALEASRRMVRALSGRVAVDLARIHRLVGSDSSVVSKLARGSDLLEYFMALETGEGMDSIAELGYSALRDGNLDQALKLAHQDSVIEARVLRLAAASDGASQELQARALALDPSAGVDQDTRWASIALAIRSGRDHTPFLPSGDEVAPSELRRMLRFVELASAGEARNAEESLSGLSPVLRGHAYSMASTVLGARAPAEWKRAATRLLFASERPAFR